MRKKEFESEIIGYLFKIFRPEELILSNELFFISLFFAAVLKETTLINITLAAMLLDEGGDRFLSLNFGVLRIIRFFIDFKIFFKFILDGSRLLLLYAL